MSWSIRHQGSPRAVEPLTLDQVIAGLRDGEWDPTDEVREPGEDRWIALEVHPRFFEMVEELADAAPTPLTEDPDEQRVDMNPLIDVCLVLLVFFILATTFQLLERVHDLPMSRVARGQPVPVVDYATVRERMIIVKLRPGAAGAAYHLDEQEVSAFALQTNLQRLMRLTHREEIVIDARNVQWGEVIHVIDAAAGAGVRKVHFRADHQ